MGPMKSPSTRVPRSSCSHGHQPIRGRSVVDIRRLSRPPVRDDEHARRRFRPYPELPRRRVPRLCATPGAMASTARRRSTWTPCSGSSACAPCGGRSRHRFRPVVPILGSLGIYVDYATGGVTDSLMMPFMVLALWRWDRFGDTTERSSARWIGPIALGIACTFKQSAWFIVPMLVTAITIESMSAGRGWRPVLRYVAPGGDRLPHPEPAIHPAGSARLGGRRVPAVPRAPRAVRPGLHRVQHDLLPGWRRPARLYGCRRGGHGSGDRRLRRLVSAGSSRCCRSCRSSPCCCQRGR